jgi:hypothetical protein
MKSKSENSKELKVADTKTFEWLMSFRPYKQLVFQIIWPRNTVKWVEDF